MFDTLYAAAADEVASFKRRILRLVIGAIVATVALILTLVAATRALFFWVSEVYGPIEGHLAVAGAALVVAAIALTVAALGRHRRRRVARATRDAKIEAFDKARAVGETVSNTLSGRTGPLNSRQGLTNAVLGAVVIGILLGRRF